VETSAKALLSAAAPVTHGTGAIRILDGEQAVVDTVLRRSGARVEIDLEASIELSEEGQQYLLPPEVVVFWRLVPPETRVQVEMEADGVCYRATKPRSRQVVYGAVSYDRFPFDDAEAEAEVVTVPVETWREIGRRVAPSASTTEPGFDSLVITQDRALATNRYVAALLSGAGIPLPFPPAHEDGLPILASAWAEVTPYLTGDEVRCSLRRGGRGSALYLVAFGDGFRVALPLVESNGPTYVTNIDKVTTRSSEPVTRFSIEAKELASLVEQASLVLPHDKQWPKIHFAVDAESVAVTAESDIGTFRGTTLVEVEEVADDPGEFSMLASSIQRILRSFDDGPVTIEVDSTRCRIEQGDWVGVVALAKR